MQVRRCDRFEALDSSTWACLTRGVPFRTKEWLESWWESYCQGELYLLAAYDPQDCLTGLLPLRLTTSTRDGNCLHWLGDGDVCTDYLTVLTSHEHQQSVCEAFAEWLIANQSSSEHAWDHLLLEGSAVSDVALARLLDALKARGADVYQRPGTACWRIDLPETWDEYLASMSKSHRKQLRRAENRVLRTEATLVHQVTSADELERGMQILIELHQRRRHSLGQPGCFACERFSSFLEAASKRLLNAGMLDLTWIENNGKPVAAEFQVSGGDTTYAYQAGIDPELMDLEPGRLAMIATIQDAIEKGQRAFDFLRGDEPYKAHWRAVPIEIGNWRVAAPKTLSRMRHKIWLAGDTLKQWIRSSIPTNADNA